MIPEKKDSNEILAIESELELISTDCENAAKEQDPQNQHKCYEAIQKRKLDFIELVTRYKNENNVTSDDAYSYMEALIGTTYEVDKLATRQSFGNVQQPPDLPKVSVSMDQLAMEEGDIVQSANQGGWSRLRENKKRVYYKNTKPDIAQLEIVAAEFYRHTLGSSHTSHGKIITDGKDIKGMYVEAMPGFVSMKDLEKLAEDPENIKNKIKKVDKDIEDITGRINKNKNNENVSVDVAKLQENIKLRSVYKQIIDKGLIDTTRKRVNVDKSPLSGIMSKVLCSAFFYEDWDRHKDNFGVSYGQDGLEVASLDYDKSFTNTFHQDNKLYDWNITPERLRDFPIFDCWYWPTQRNAVKGFASFFGSAKAAKMYSSEEATQYRELKDNPEFQRQGNIEWLKLIFIPQELRQFSVNNLTSKSSETLRKIPKTFEEKRQSLINAAIQLNRFREMFKDKETLNEVKKELKASLSTEEFEIVNRHWEKTEYDIADKIKKVEEREKIASNLGCNQLIKAIKKTGISFSSEKPDLNTDFQKKLENILSWANEKSSKSLCDTINREFGLSISEEDVNAIKQEIPINIKEGKKIEQQVDEFVSEVFKLKGFDDKLIGTNKQKIKILEEHINKSLDRISSLKLAIEKKGGAAFKNRLLTKLEDANLSYIQPLVNRKNALSRGLQNGKPEEMEKKTVQRRTQQEWIENSFEKNKNLNTNKQGAIKLDVDQKNVVDNTFKRPRGIAVTLHEPVNKKDPYKISVAMKKEKHFSDFVDAFKEMEHPTKSDKTTRKVTEVLDETGKPSKLSMKITYTPPDTEEEVIDRIKKELEGNLKNKKFVSPEIKHVKDEPVVMEKESKKFML